LPVQIQLRRGTENEWSSSDPILALGELAISTDTEKIKIGNGSSLWSQLDYINALPSELDSDNISEGTTNLFFTPERAVEAVAGGMFDTDVVEEGTVNLYYTDARVEDVISNSSTDNVFEGTVNLYFTDQRAIDAVAGGTFSTDVVEEGTNNLYFTDQRAVDAVVNGSVNTDDIEEGTTNLYYTDSRVEDVIANSTTDDIDEGTINLYFTDIRAQDATPGRIISSSTQPESPSAGDGWLDISTGKLYVYITDEDSSQWIEV